MMNSLSVRPKVQKNEEAIRQAHGLCQPTEIRIGDPITAALVDLNHHSPSSSSIRVWRISSLGIELVSNPETTGLSRGSHVSLQIRVGLHNTRLTGAVVSKHHELGHDLIGIHFDSSMGYLGEERRLTKRWASNLQCLPTGSVSNPLQVDSSIYFNILDISSSGLAFTVDLKNRFLLPGQILKCSINLPFVGVVKTTIEICNVREGQVNDAKALIFGARFVFASQQMRQAIGQYLYEFGPLTSVRELRKHGLSVHSAGKAVEFRYVETPEEYQQVLELRYLAYKEAGKIENRDNTFDVFDSRSRILIGLHKGQVIASVRLIFNSETDLTEHEQYLTLPASLPPREEICEITRVCTHPDYRGADVLYGMFRALGLAVVQSGRRYVLGCATKDLLPLYLKIGFESTGVKFSNESLGHTEHTMFIGDVPSGLCGQKVGPLPWNLVWGDLVTHLIDQKVMKPTWAERMRINMYRLLKPLTLWLIDRTKRTARVPKAIAKKKEA